MLAILLALPASAQTRTLREEGANASALGRGDAVRSSATGPTALYFNPAAMHQFVQYALETGYQFVGPTEGHVFSAAVVDSATNQHVSAGMAYTYVMGNELTTDKSRTGHMIRGGLASGYKADGWALHGGIGIRYMSLTINDSSSAEGFTMDAGLLLVAANIFRFALVGHNLIETPLSETRRSLAVGASLLYANFLLAFDANLDFETREEMQAELNAGAEYAISGVVPLRVGYMYDQITGNHHITAGIGYVSQYAGADFGFRQNMGVKDDNIFSLNVKMFIP